MFFVKKRLTELLALSFKVLYQHPDFFETHMLKIPYKKTNYYS